ncbi:MAG: hypothetical protein DLM55_06810 [Acidimicrobiales bacterium]|nr:MAG: hypothetical protein DLM55_06810 [Acidimicrobiales bacterium]
MTGIDFLQRFQEFLGRNGWSTDRSPWSVVEEWESLVEQAQADYRWGYYEFTNDLSVRDLLEAALCDETLKKFEQIAVMRELVNQADAHFKQALLAEVKIGGVEQPWWRRGVLAHASEEYAEDMSRLYGMKVGCGDS